MAALSLSRMLRLARRSARRTSSASPLAALRTVACLSSPPAPPAASVRPAPAAVRGPTFQQAVARLQEFWASAGCSVFLPHNSEVGAGTMNPATFLRVLGPEPWSVCYAEPSVRPDDSRYGDNPNRVQRHTQFQVILKPEPGNAQELYLASLGALGIDVAAHDVRFVEDNWESPVLGAWGLGWEVWLDGMEVTQFTYFQQAGALPLRPAACEITYGLERVLMALQGVTHFRDIRYSDTLTYGEAWLQNEVEQSTYALQVADVAAVRARFAAAAQESSQLLAARLPLPAYDALLRASHAFNILDARGAVGVTERAELFGVMRSRARDAAQLWLQRREELGFPLLKPAPALAEPAAGGDPWEGELPTQAAPFVLEVGLEELPAAEVGSAIAQLREKFPLLLQRLRLGAGAQGVRVGGTPRRLLISVDALPHRTEARSERVRGPPAKAGRTADGAWSGAALGFAKKAGVEADKVFIAPDESVKGAPEYLWATVDEPGRPAAAALAAELPGLIGGLAWARTMRWGAGEEAGSAGYPRPLRWLLALHGDCALRFSCAGVAAGRTTFGLRKPVAQPLLLRSAGEHAQALAAMGVVAEPEARSEVIAREAAACAAAAGGELEVDPGLLAEVCNLVEAPVLLRGSFDADYLTLPREVLVTVMRKHQRYFPVLRPGGGGALLPAFVTAANGGCDPALVVAGNEAVLRARLEDARFFYQADLLKPIEQLRSALAGTVFEARLGSMLAKCERTEKLVEGHFAAALGLETEEAATAGAAARLSRFDLSSQLVQEFTNLAGTMGRHYALASGLPPSLAEAVFEATLPRQPGDLLPASAAGRCVALADRLDALTGLFAVGCAPSATADPFGCRRYALGFLEPLITPSPTLPAARLGLAAAVAASAALQPVPCSADVQAQLVSFLQRRLETALVDRGSEFGSVEGVRAVLAERGDCPAAAAAECAELARLQAERPALVAAVMAALARPTRLVRGKAGGSGEVDPALFEQEEERALFAALLAAEARVAASLAAGGAGASRVRALFEAAEGLAGPLDAFFTGVFVMAEDERVRGNRLALAGRVAGLPRGALDLAALPGF